MNPLDEAGAWGRAAAGDGDAFGRLFDAHHRRVFRHGLRLTGDVHDAEDVLAAAFLELWRRRKDVRVVDGSVLPWLLVTAGNLAPTFNKVARDALPLTDAFDPDNAQDLAPLNPAAGLSIDVSPGTHWRLYAVYTDGRNPGSAPVGNGKTPGIPSNEAPPDLVPAVATNGKSGWVDYHLLTDQAQPRLTPEGTSQAPIPVYGADGTTVIGEADVSQPYRR